MAQSSRLKAKSRSADFIEKIFIHTRPPRLAISHGGRGITQITQINKKANFIDCLKLIRLKAEFS